MAKALIVSDHFITWLAQIQKDIETITEEADNTGHVDKEIDQLNNNRATMLDELAEIAGIHWDGAESELDPGLESDLSDTLTQFRNAVEHQYTQYFPLLCRELEHHFAIADEELQEGRRETATAVLRHGIRSAEHHIRLAELFEHNPNAGKVEQIRHRLSIRECELIENAA